jgi:hypothetical protein
MSTAAQKRQHRIDHGLCPVCGKDAAPYYLCHTHRQRNALSRLLDKAAERGIFQREKEAGKVYYKHKPDSNTFEDFAWAKSMWDMNANDARLKPRMGRRPVDLDETLMSIFVEAGRPLTMEEIYAAWGKLRTLRKTNSLAGDMTAIILAQRRREEKNAKRAALAKRIAR